MERVITAPQPQNLTTKQTKFQANEAVLPHTVESLGCVLPNVKMQVGCPTKQKKEKASQLIFKVSITSFSRANDGP